MNNINLAWWAHETSVVDKGAEIGLGTKIWHFSHVCGTAIIGDHCVLGQNVYVGQEVQIGSGSKIQNNVSVYDAVTIDEDVFIGPSVVFTNVINPRAFINRKSKFLKTNIKKGATIGANSTIVCGVDIGCYAFVGAGALVRENVRDFSVVVGNPAVHIGWISRNGFRLNFTSNKISEAICPESGEIYILIDNNVRLKEIIND